MGRNDLHKPSAAENGHYKFLSNFYLGSGGEEFADYFAELCSNDPYLWEDAKAKFESFGGNFENKGTCDHCGAHFLWGCCYLHLPTGRLVHVGHTCASNSFDYSSRVSALKGRASKKLAEIRAFAKKRAARSEKFWAENTDLRESLPAALETDHYISRDLKASFEKWGSLSAKQVALAFKLVKDVAAEAARRAAREAKLAANPPSKVPATDERVTIKGTVVSLKWKTDFYGETLKLLVESEAGYRLYGTCPRALAEDDDAVRGAVVEFAAKVERSKDDEFFGFFKRPTRASVLSPAPGEEDDAESAPEEAAA